MKQKIIIASIAVSLFFCSTIFAQVAFIGNNLKKVWEATDGFDIPESAYFNKFDKTIYVSNIGKSDSKDGIGYISKLSMDGKLIIKEWVKGLNAPKGIRSTKSRLYVTDIDRVLEIDLKTGKILKEFRNSKSKSLNDVTITLAGKVYISDSGGNCIFTVGKDSLEIFMEDARIKGMNGIFNDGKLIYIGAGNKFLSIDMKAKEIKTLAENVGYLDGIEMISKGVYVTSDWKGTVQLINVGGSVEKLIDTTPIKVHAADLGYIPSKKMILVPTFSENSIVAYLLDN